MTPDLSKLGTQQAIVIAGNDARRFAQAQFCGDVDALAPQHWQWNGWLTPVGKVRALMHVVETGDDSLLLLPRGGDIPALIADLQHYVMRAQVALSLREFTAYADVALPAGQAIRSGDALMLGFGERSLHLVPGTNAAPIDSHADDAWRLAAIRAGWPRLPDGEPAFLPPALALERLGAIAFDKGCYPGQEIAARLHFRGGHKHRLCHLRGPAPLSVGAIRTADGADAFVLESVCEDGVCDALVVINEQIEHEIMMMDCIYHTISSFSA